MVVASSPWRARCQPGSKCLKAGCKLPLAMVWSQLAGGKCNAQHLQISQTDLHFTKRKVDGVKGEVPELFHVVDVKPASSVHAI